MSRLAALVVLLLPAVAAADGVYFSERVGTYAVGGELGGQADGPAVNMSVVFGGRTGLWGVEFGGGLTEWYGEEFAALTTSRFGVAVKRFVPLHRHLDLYVRGGLDKVHLDTDLDSLNGRGVSYGVGVQLKGRIPAAALLVPYLALIPKFPGPKVTAALIFDLGGEFARVRGGCETIDLEAQGWNIGIAFGSDL